MNQKETSDKLCEWADHMVGGKKSKRLEKKGIHDSMKGLLIALIILAIIVLISFWTAYQWVECRDMGFSFWYCVQHIL